MDSELSFNKKSGRKFHLYSIYFKHKNQIRRKFLRQNYFKSSFFLAPAHKHLTTVTKASRLCSNSLCSRVHKQPNFTIFAEPTSKTRLKIFKNRWKKSCHERHGNVSEVAPTKHHSQNNSNLCMTTAGLLDAAKEEHQSRKKNIVQSKRHNYESFHANQPRSISSIDSADTTTIITDSIKTAYIDNNKHFLRTQTQSCHYMTRDLQNTQSCKNQTKCGISWDFINSTKSCGIIHIDTHNYLFESPPCDMRGVTSKQNNNDPTATGSRQTKPRTSSANHEFTPYANYRNFFKWRRYSAMQKFAKFLMPFFILVNMLPLLYAGE